MGIQAISMTSFAEFQNFQASNPLSTTFQGLEKWKKIFRTFKVFQGRAATLQTR